MADPSINDVCDALALAITTGTGLRALGYIDEQVNPPMVMVYTMPFDPRLTTGGSPERSVRRSHGGVHILGAPAGNV